MDLRETALDIFHRTLRAIDVEAVAARFLRLEGDRLWVGDEVCDLRAFRRIVVTGIGKACVPMARAVEAVLGDRITAGLLVTNAVIGESPRRLPVLIGGHPLPNAASLEAAAAALALLRQHDAEDTLLIFLVTGGGSAMFEQPIDASLTLDDLQGVNRALVGCGAVIGEMNVVRRHLSAVKGGRLAAAAPRARQISLYVSDVNGDDLRSVASGPTLASTATLDDFHRIVDRYRLREQFPPRVAALIEAGAIPPMPQAKDVGESASLRRSHHLLLDNRRALEAARDIAECEHGLAVEIAGDLIEGDVETMMLMHIERIVLLRERNRGRRVCLLSGGEVVCPVRGAGQGGRNQEFALRAAIHLALREFDGVVCLSAGTDGIDGNSPAAGAIADATTLPRAKAATVSAEMHLIHSDSFNFFHRLGDAILTGPTGNNVRDLRILLAA
jgi:hydroxypyruvate reductase